MSRYNFEELKFEPELKPLEYTLCLIKPDVYKYSKNIINTITAKGFKILKKRTVLLSPEQTSVFYAEHYGKTSFALIVATMSKGPIVALCLAKDNCIEDFRSLIGPANVGEARRLFPTSLRAKYGLQANMAKNALHGSDNLEKAQKEIHFFFPDMIMEPLSTHVDSTDYLNAFVNPTLLEGLAQVCKHKPVDPTIWLADWLLANNRNKPRLHPALEHTPT